MQTPLVSILQSTRLRHRGFRLASPEQLRVSNRFVTLLQNGIITKAPIHDAQWISARLVSTLATSLLRYALVSGTYDLNVDISRALSLALASTLSAMAGDIARSPFYGQTHCLTFGNGSLKLNPEFTPSNMQFSALYSGLHQRLRGRSFAQQDHLPRENQRSPVKLC